MSASLPSSQAERAAVIAGLLVLIVFSELTARSWHRRLSLRWLVPADLVTVEPTLAARRWGRALATGYLTDAPYGAFPGMLLSAVVLGSPAVAATTAAVFAAARAFPYLSRPLRTRLLTLAEGTNGRGSWASVSARGCSITALLGGIVVAAMQVWDS